MNEKKTSPLKFAIGEVLVVISLCFLIIVTLNYFKILPLSENFGFLAGLPQQSTSSSPQGGKPKGDISDQIFVRSVVMPFRPLIIKNTSTQTESQYVATSTAKLYKSSINVQMVVADKSDTTGISFANDKKYTTKEYRSLQIFRDIKSQNWMLQYITGSDSTYTYLTSSYNGNDFKNFTIMIENNGRNLTILSPSFVSKKITLPSSFYEFGNNIHASANVGPGATFTIFSLTYQSIYPF